MRARTAAALVVACLALGGLTVGALGGNGPVDIRGVYDATSHVGAAAYPQTWHVTQENLTTGAFSGVDTSEVGNFSIVGKVTGSSLTVTVSQGTYVSRGTATLTVSGGRVHMAGTFVDSNGTRGTFAATFPLSTGSAHPTTTTTKTTTTPTTTTPTAAKRPTFTAVVCTIAVTTPSSSCTAQVADASVQRSSPPTGTVELLGRGRHGRELVHAGGDARLAGNRELHGLVRPGRQPRPGRAAARQRRLRR